MSFSNLGARLTDRIADMGFGIEESSSSPSLSETDDGQPLSSSPVDPSTELYLSLSERLAVLKHPSYDLDSSSSDETPLHAPIYHLTSSASSSSSLSLPVSSSDDFHAASPALLEPDENVECQAPDLAPLTVYMLHPLRWSSMFDHQGNLPSPFETLKAGSWVESMVLDLWLLNRWQTLGRPTFRYIPFNFLHEEVTPQSTALFRHMFDIEPGNRASTHPAIALIHINGDHFCCMAFLPNALEVHVLGRSIVADAPKRIRNPKWARWGGDRVYRKAAQLHGWDESAKISVYEVNWQQNGIDCGPIAAQVMNHIWTNGGLARDYLSYWRKPPMSCAHRFRLLIAEDVHATVLANIERLVHLNDTPLPQQLDELFSHDHDLGTWADVMAMVRAVEAKLQPNPGALLQALVTNIKTALASCSACLSKADKRANAKSHHGNQETGIGVSEDGPHVKEWSMQIEETHEQPEQVAAVVNKPYHVKDWDEADMRRFPRPVDPPALPALKDLRGLWLPFCEDYDEYEGGPSSEILKRIPETIEQFAEINVAYIPEKIIHNIWTTFIDYGYRLPMSFCQAYYLRQPFMLREHLMPVGIQHCYEPPTFLLIKNRRREEVAVEDFEVMGAGEMLAKARADGTDEMFITGLTGESKYVCLDLERDKLQPPAVVVTVDIDSLIWVTRFPRFKKSVNVFQRPVIRNRAPIFKHNHIYIDLYLPPSSEDADQLGGRSEWDTRRLQLSHIPHVLFGKVSDSANLLLAFPRMAHQHPYTGHWQSNVAWDVQGVLWDKILLPAMRSVVSEPEKLYVGLDREHSSFKDGDQGTRLPPTYPFKKKTFQRLTSAIQGQIDASLGALSHFGSFFFVVEVKGCKNLTRQSVTLNQGDGVLRGSCAGLLDDLHSEFSAFDWAYMEERSNGEVYVDLGVTYNPSGVQQKMVGLWRLPSLEASYGAGGYLRGNLHNHNTLSLFGGLQAEMKGEHSRCSHISFRSSYNLAYEATRLKSNSRSLFNEKDVYQANEKFLESGHKILGIFSKKAKGKSYGVRDEFRMSYLGLKECVDFLDKEIESMIRSEPILWLSTDVWFDFLYQRLRSLVESQLSLAMRSLRPSNYGVTSGIFTFLMQSVLFTPLIVNRYVRESLALLNYRASLSRFGMFFLHELNLTHESEILPGVLQKDDTEILRKLGIDNKPVHRFKPHLERKRNQPPANPELYPIGRTPSWTELVDALKNRPWDIIRPVNPHHTIPDLLEPPPGSLAADAAKLFIDWTKGIWSTLNSSWKVSRLEFIEVNTLEEAICFWTVESLHEHLQSYIVIPCNSSFRTQLGGVRAANFRQRVLWYFAPTADGFNWATRWPALGEPPGFLHTYQAISKARDEHGMDEIHGLLEAIFGLCQCLPNTNINQHNIWDLRDNSIALLGNPELYRIDSLGTEPKLKGPRKRNAPAHTSKKQFKNTLLRNDGKTEAQAKLLVSRLKATEKALQKKAVKTRNYRRPPAKKQNEQKSKVVAGMEKGEEDNEDDDWNDEPGEVDKSGSNRQDTSQTQTDRHCHRPHTRSQTNHLATHAEDSDEEDNNSNYEATKKTPPSRPRRRVRQSRRPLVASEDESDEDDHGNHEDNIDSYKKACGNGKDSSITQNGWNILRDSADGSDEDYNDELCEEGY